jgi:hypothetical protein
VKLIAKPNEGYVFDKWSGHVNSSDNPLTFTILQDTTVYCQFAKATISVTDTTGDMQKQPGGSTIKYSDGSTKEMDYAAAIANSTLIKQSTTPTPTWVPSANYWATNAQEYYVRGIALYYKQLGDADASAALNASSNLIALIREQMTNDINMSSGSASDKSYAISMLETVNAKITGFSTRENYYEERYMSSDTVKSPFYNYYIQNKISLDNMNSIKIQICNSNIAKANAQSKPGVANIYTQLKSKYGG